MALIGLRHLKTGWEDPEFETKIKMVMNEALADGFVYHDIKISSKTNDCLLIFVKS